MILADSAQQISRNITKYHNIFLICLIAAICFLIVAIALFFLLKIPKVFMIITGLSKKMEIKQLDDNAAYTSQLTNLKTGKSMKNEPPRRRKTEMYSASGKLNVKQGSIPVTQIDPNATYADPRSETTLLSNSPEESIGTTVLSHDSGEQETSILRGGDRYQKISKRDFGFRPSREILLIHTDEDII